MQDNYSHYYPFFDAELNFDPVPSVRWMKANWTSSIWISVSYLFFVYSIQIIMRRRKALELNGLLFLWNASLSMFSFLGFTRMTPEFFYVLSRKNFHHSICKTTYAVGVTGFWTQLFAFSKALELLDTAFIVLRKRPVIFLHVYHHVTVLVYTWHAYQIRSASGRWFVWMNFLVHSIMYAYFAVRSLGYRTPKNLSVAITTLQLTQMVVGCFIALASYNALNADSSCQQTFENLYFSFFIYFTYFILFARYFHDAYLVAKPTIKFGPEKKMN
uniref:Elongation of very long chain fatty acids protein n=1 Tax=Romanomermis culicivorax TaxID=13658 RepID=A0A915JF23_ROMCU